MDRTYHFGRPPDVEAEITMLPPSEGGRARPFYSGYRPNHKVRKDYLTSGVHDYLDQESIQPGQTARGTITFLRPEAYPGCLWVGHVINVQEGGRVVGHARITKILNPILQKADA